MGSNFAHLAFTPAVQAMQARQGSAASYARQLAETATPVHLGENESAFIAARDGFYQSSVSETGWPYVQFRGGPAGFLKVLDANTIGYADFRGNRQYVSTGNFTGNDRVALILMDYANRARLKILGRVRLVDVGEDPQLVARLEMPGYRARVERGVVITVEAFDWNCPQHITPRFTREELGQSDQAARVEIATLRAELAVARRGQSQGQ